ncbi:MAG: hypothetical protein WA579_08895, partial [Rhodomicrobium sp.]
HFVNHRNSIIFSNLNPFSHPRQRCCAFWLLRRIDEFLTKHAAGNKSGALLLTTFVLTARAENECLTIDIYPDD